jgi:hypothetical protein
MVLGVYNLSPFHANYYYAYQRVDVAGGGTLEFSATATVSEATTSVKGLGHVRIGLTTKLPGLSNTTTEFNAGTWPLDASVRIG